MGPVDAAFPICIAPPAGRTWASWAETHSAAASVAIYKRGKAENNRFRSPQTGAFGWGSWSMLNEVYNKRILELAGNIPRLYRMSDPDASATAHSKLYGSTVTADLKMDGDTVTDFAHDVKACALGQASSSIMASHVIGAKAAELREPARDRPQDAEGERCTAEGRQVGRHRGARAGAGLQGTPWPTMLTFDAVVDAIGQIEGKRRAAGG